MTRTTIKVAALAAAVSLGAVALAPQEAQARSRAGPFIAGFAIGAIIGGAIASDRRHYYYAPAYRYRPRPWTRAWYDYCFARYRSFDPYSGTYQPYHGPRRLCR